MSAVDNQVAPPLTWHEMAQTFVQAKGLKVGVEVGVWYGGLSRRLLAAGVEALTLVDPWQVVTELTDQGLRIWGPGYTTDEMEAAAHSVLAETEPRVWVFREPSILAARHVPDFSQDFVILDARHDYAAVMDDIEAWLLKVKPGGYLLGDDYGDYFPGVAKAVHEWFKDDVTVEAPLWYRQVPV